MHCGTTFALINFWGAVDPELHEANITGVNVSVLGIRNEFAVKSPRTDFASNCCFKLSFFLHHCGHRFCPFGLFSPQSAVNLKFVPDSSNRVHQSVDLSKFTLSCFVQILCRVTKPFPWNLSTVHGSQGCNSVTACNVITKTAHSKAYVQPLSIMTN